MNYCQRSLKYLLLSNLKKNSIGYQDQIGRFKCNWSLNTFLDIGRVKPLKDGGLLVGCDDTKTFRQIAKGKFAQDYEIREVRSLRATIKMAGFSDDIDEESFLKIYL